MGWYPGVPPGPIRSNSLAASWIVISLLPPLQRGLATAFCRLRSSGYLMALTYTESLTDQTLTSFMDCGRCVKISSDSTSEGPEAWHDIRRAGASRCGSGTVGAY